MKSSGKLHTNLPNLKKSDGQLTTTDQEIADTLNNQFHKSFTVEDTSNTPNIPLKTIQTPCLDTIEIKDEDVRKAMKSLKTGKRVLKEMAPILSTPLSIIYRQS